MPEYGLADVTEHRRVVTLGEKGEEWIGISLVPDGEEDYDLDVRWGGGLTFEDVVNILHNTAHDMADSLDDEEED